MRPEIGSTLLHYAIEARLGEGGMGTVYRARDTRLNRTVALKVLHAGTDAEAIRRLLREARAASALSHPNSVTIHAVEQHGDLAFIVMEHVAGEPLDRAIPPGGLPIDRALDLACDVTAAVAAAHTLRIVHRDLKPANVIVTPDGRAKVLDFGIARRAAAPDDATHVQTSDGTVAGTGTLVGTIGYMAPEQIAGEAASERSDVFALGVVIFELLTGVSPFRRETSWATIDATLRQPPAAIAGLRPDVPDALTRIVTRCLAKDPSERPASAEALLQELDGVRRTRAAAPVKGRVAMRWVAVAAVIVAVAGIAMYMRERNREGRVRWVQDTAVPEISRLVASGDALAAYRVGLRARAMMPTDPRITSAWDGFTQTMPIASTPPGAVVSIRSLSGQDEGWIPLGTTPLTADVPLGQLRWRFTLAGYDPLEIVPNPFPTDVVLVRTGTAPPGMAHVAAGTVEHPSTGVDVDVPEYWIDVNEVTNRQFKEFIERGGYRNSDYWREPFVGNGRTLSWEEAMDAFRDSTGQPGPATWELGSFPEGQADWPVHGLSWYEAAAYARFAGKSLPTIYHWYRASGAIGVFSDVLRFSNFGGKGPARVGTSGSLGPFGTQDMAGNVKEWVWNQSAAGRYILGGAWNEPPYLFHDQDARDPMERRAGFGVRCIKSVADVPGLLGAPITTLARDPASLKPVSDDIFQAYRRLYDYDPRPLDARVDETDETSSNFILERVSFTAAYGNERVPLMLFLPRQARPPYQVSVYFPGSDAVRTQSSRSAYLQMLEFLPRSGRAVAFPVYQQTFERRRPVAGQNFLREIGLQRGQDLRRTIDYLETRADIDATRVTFYGLSLGAQLGPVFLAVEPRLKAGVLLSGGFETWTVPPETEPVNFATRVTQPVLMINGREDFDLPYETAQLPMFRMLGTKPQDKQHVVLDGGHLPPRPNEVFREILRWLELIVGPVAR